MATPELNTASFQGDSSGPDPGEMFVRLLNLAPPLSPNHIRILGTGTQHQVLLAVGVQRGDLTLIFRLDNELERVETASGKGGRWPPWEERYRAGGGGKALGPLEPVRCSQALSSTRIQLGGKWWFTELTCSPL